jgi:hypothetical protein
LEVMEVKRRSSQKRQVATRNISLPPVFDAALVILSQRAGHGNYSRIVQDLLAREARMEIGSDWQEVVLDGLSEKVPA